MMIRAMKAEDVAEVALIHAEAFKRQKLSETWISASFQAYPKSLCFVSVNGVIEGYVIWTIKSGFRDDVVLELEQLAVLSAYQKKGVASRLISESLLKVKAHLAQQGSRLKHIMISTRADNHAQRIYKTILNAKVETTISNLYSADEVIMIARNV